MMYTDEAKQNFKALSNNPYPGRGIVLGESADGKSYVQVYWIMGRSVNSRNRVFEMEAKTGFMKTKAFDESKLTDPHLIIYYPARHTADVQIITNGDQTDTIYDAIKLGGTFESALRTRQYEDDAPNFTPRISGIHYKNAEPAVYKLSILKSRNNSEEAGCERMTFEYEKSPPGSRPLHQHIRNRRQPDSVLQRLPETDADLRQRRRHAQEVLGRPEQGQQGLPDGQVD